VAIGFKTLSPPKVEVEFTRFSSSQPGFEKYVDVLLTPELLAVGISVQDLVAEFSMSPAHPFWQFAHRGWLSMHLGSIQPVVMA
jgi:hypothetical protein